MKKTLILPSIIALLIVLGFTEKLHAQALEKGFTLKLAYVSPATDFGTFSIADPENPFDQYYLTKANPGFALQLGTMYFINAIDLGDQMKIGVDVTWLSANYQTTTHSYQIQRTDDGTGISAFHNGEFDMQHIYFMAEVGPSFSYSPIEKLAFDVSFKASPTFDLIFGNYNVNVNGGNTETLLANGLGLRFTPAFYARYSVLLLGVEYNMGNMNINYQGSGGAFSGSQRSDVPFSSIRILLGFKF